MNKNFTPFGLSFFTLLQENRRKEKKQKCVIKSLYLVGTKYVF